MSETSVANWLSIAVPVFIGAAWVLYSEWKHRKHMENYRREWREFDERLAQLAREFQDGNYRQ